MRDVMHAEVEPNDNVFLFEIFAVEVFLKVDDRVERIVAVGADSVNIRATRSESIGRMETHLFEACADVNSESCCSAIAHVSSSRRRDFTARDSLVT